MVTDRGSKSDEFTLYPIGDIHLGAKACDVPALARTVERVRADRNARWIGMGDYAEHITISDKRFDLKTIDPRYLPELDDLPAACVRDLVGILSPIRDKCLGLVVGNHEESLRLRNSHNVHGALCVALGAANLGYDSIVRWTFKRSSHAAATIKILASHGTIAGRRNGGKVNRMEDVASNFDVDVALFGHGHSQLAAERIELSVPSSGRMRLQEKKKVFMMTGTYRRNHTEGTLDYGEKAGFAPVPIGSPRIRIRPWATNPRDRFRVEIG